MADEVLRKRYLQEQIARAQRAAQALRFAYEQVQRRGALPDPIPPEHALALEALTARFARLADLLIQKVFRAQDALLLEDEGTLIDRLNRAERRGVIDSAADWRQIRALRNQIAHEYVLEDLRPLFEAVLRWTPVLLATTQHLGGEDSN